MCEDDNGKNGEKDKGDEDMVKVAYDDIKPFEVNFKDENERQEFIKWADTKNKENNPIRNEMIKGMKEMRRIRKRGND